MVTLARSPWAVAVLSAVRDRLPEQGLHGATRSSPAASMSTAPPRHPDPVRLHDVWLTRCGRLDLLHVVYEHPDFDEPLEYRVEMDLRVDEGLGPRAFACTADVEAQQIVQEIRCAADDSLLALLSRVDGRLCWGSAMS